MARANHMWMSATIKTPSTKNLNIQYMRFAGLAIQKLGVEKMSKQQFNTRA